MKNSLFLKALNCQNEGKPPVWLMRQAGRYLPEYRRLKEKYSFLQMCHTPELIVQVTKLPIDTFHLDAAILFSDILVIPEAFGLGLSFEDTKGPIIHRPIVTTDDVAALIQPDISTSLNYVQEGIKQLVKELNVPLIGFAGAPFTVASYMIEGGSSRDLKKTKQFMMRHPESFHQLLSKITSSTIDYLNMQIKAGVHALQIFDSWANFLSDSHFKEFSLTYLNKILLGLKSNTPVILFCRGSSLVAPLLADIKPAGISIDWQANLSALRKIIPQNIALQGNLDPDILYGPHDFIRKEVKTLVNSMKNDPAFIFNLGHGMLPDMSPDAVKVLVDAVRN